MKNENEICAREKKDKKTAVLLILLTTAVYALSNVGRKSYDANINEIMNFFSAGKEAAGLAGTFFFVSYGIGQVVHGLLCTKYNPKYSILLAAITGAFCNLILAVLPQSAFPRLNSCGASTVFRRRRCGLLPFLFSRISLRRDILRSRCL